MNGRACVAALSVLLTACSGGAHRVPRAATGIQIDDIAPGEALVPPAIPPVAHVPELAGAGRVLVRAGSKPAPETTLHLSFGHGADGFRLEQHPAASAVTWDRTNERIDVRVDRSDPSDILFSRPLGAVLTPAAGFAVSLRWRVTAQGNGQEASPILLAPSGATATTGPDTFAVVYTSRDQGAGEDPVYEIQYRDRRGVVRLDGEVILPQDQTYRLELRYDARTRQLIGRILSADGVALLDQRYRLNGTSADSFAFEKVAFDAWAWGAAETKPIEGWLDDVDIHGRGVH